MYYKDVFEISLASNILHIIELSANIQTGVTIGRKLQGTGHFQRNAFRTKKI